MSLLSSRALLLEVGPHGLSLARAGEHLTLLFEDELTFRYQVQEMLRIEKTFEEAGRFERRVAARLRRKGFAVWQK